MNLLTAERMRKAYSDKIILEDAAFYLDEGEKVGIIGINGTGKSTLLKIIGRVESLDDGNVTMANNKVVRFLEQHPVYGDCSVMEYVLSDAKDSDDIWTLTAKAKSMLGNLGISQFDEAIGHMSGGQRKKISLVRTLLYDADLLILDEPTNHLDNDMTEWLEGYLRGYRGAVVMVTHDRYFLDSVTNRIVELDKGKIYSYKTNYSGFLELKAERVAMDKATDDKKDNLLRNELKWVMRGAKARSTKQKARLERYEELKNRKHVVDDATIEIESVSTRLGRTIIEMDSVSKSYLDNTVVSDFTYIFLKNDRIGIVGPNGCGKTTLLKMIIGEIIPDSGNITIGQTVKIGYYAQEVSTNPADGIRYMNPELKVIDYIRNTAEYVKTVDGEISASAMLNKFLFPPKAQQSLIKSLSGGEKRRLNLLRVLMEAPNVLILDEPTNDLDIQTLTILEDYIDNFDGVVISVSHDRYFLDRTARRIFAYNGNGSFRQFEGGYTDYSIVKEFEQQPEIVLEAKKDAKKVWHNEHEKKLKFTYKEQKEFETIEEDIEALENKISEIDALIVKNATDFGKLNELDKEKNKLSEELDYKMQRWEYLTELDEKIKAQ